MLSATPRRALLFVVLVLAPLATSSAQPVGERDASGLWWTHPLDHPYRRSATDESLASLPQLGDELALEKLRGAGGEKPETGRLVGERGTIVVVIRSLTWSPFCRAQVDAWARRIADAREIGYEVVVVSARASEGAGDMPLLVAGDEALGLQNPRIEEGEEGFGTLTPATFVLSPDGRVEHRFVDKHHARRVTPGTVLAALAPPNAAMSAPVAGQGLRASATLLDPALWLEAQSTLLVRLELDPGRYIYTDPLPDGFIATTVQVLPTEGLRLSRIAYPPAESKEFPDLGVTLPIYEGVADFLVPVRATSELLGFEVERPTNGYPLFVRVDYQTCSSNFCFSPQTLELYVEVSAQALQP